SIISRNTNERPHRLFFFILLRPPPRTTLFPYTTLFRSISPRKSIFRRPIFSSVGATYCVTQPPSAERVSGVYSTSGSCAMMTPRSEEHTSELQSRGHLVFRLSLEKKNT